MTKENALSFLQLIRTDSDFAAKVLSTESTEEVLTLAKDRGLDLHHEDLKNLSMELSDEELELIAGGKKNPPRRGRRRD